MAHHDNPRCEVSYPSGAQDSPRQSRWNHSTGHIGLSQAITSPYSSWPQKQNTSFPTKHRYRFSQKHVNTARLIFAWYSLQCDLYSCGVLLQRLSLARSFLLVDTSERCCSQISTYASPSVKSVSFASAIFFFTR